MSVYNRKGGSGKSGSLRQQFNYYRRQLQNRLIKEEAFSRARTKGRTPEQRPYNLFKRMDYNDIMQRGISRKQGWETVTITGEEAIKIQIQSMKNRASKSYQSETYISNYLSAMVEVGFDYEYIDEAERLLKSVSTDKLTIMIQQNLIPQIYFLYTQDSDDEQEEFMEELRNVFKTSVPTTKEVREIKQRAKQYESILKQEYKDMW